MSRLKRMFRWAAKRELMTWEAFYRLKEIEGLKLGRTKAREMEAVKPVCENLVAETTKGRSSFGNSDGLGVTGAMGGRTISCPQFGQLIVMAVAPGT